MEIIFFGVDNGGIMQHLRQIIYQQNLIGGMYKDKKSPLKSVCLNVDTAFITVFWSNDDSF